MSSACSQDTGSIHKNQLYFCTNNEYAETEIKKYNAIYNCYKDDAML